MSEAIDRERCLERISYWKAMEQRLLYKPVPNAELRDKMLDTFRQRIEAWEKRLASLAEPHAVS